MLGLLRFVLALAVFVIVCVAASAAAFAVLVHEKVLPIEAPAWRMADQPPRDVVPVTEADPKDVHPLLQNLVVVQDDGTLVPLVQRAVPAPVEYLYVALSASLTMDAGPSTRIEVRGRGADCPQGFNPGRRTSQGWTSDFEGGSAVSAQWCVAVAPGSGAGYRSFTGAWETADGPLEADYEVKYLRFATPDGRAGALKATALALCDENKGCGHFASIRLEEDNLLVEDIAQVERGEYVQVRLTADDEAVQPAVFAGLSPKEPNGYRLAQLP